MNNLQSFCLRGGADALHHDFTPQSRPNYRGLSEIAETDAITPCPKCNSTEIDLVPMPGNSPHHAKQACASCSAFRGWEPRPENKQKQQQRQTTISQMLLSSRLSEWEREFLQSLKGRRTLSPRQREVLARIEVKLGGQG